VFADSTRSGRAAGTFTDALPEPSVAGATAGALAAEGPCGVNGFRAADFEAVGAAAAGAGANPGAPASKKGPAILPANPKLSAPNANAATMAKPPTRDRTRSKRRRLQYQMRPCRGAVPAGCPKTEVILRAPRTIPSTHRPRCCSVCYTTNYQPGFTREALFL